MFPVAEIKRMICGMEVAAEMCPIDNPVYVNGNAFVHPDDIPGSDPVSSGNGIRFSMKDDTPALDRLMNNSLSRMNPKIAAEWHPTKNGALLPDMVAVKANRMAWWMCDQGHEYSARISARTGKTGTKCPYCSGRLPIRGKTDFATVYPKWATNWDPDKNDDRPTDVTWCSGKKRYFLCPVCHGSFEIALSKFTRSENHCPYCAHQKPLPGFNTIADLYPDLIPFWDQERNMGRTPYNTVAGGKTKYWWKCENGYDHSYETMVQVRTQCGCPYCQRTKVLTGFNDLATTHPSIAEEWDVEGNLPLLPSLVLAGDQRKVKWICPTCGKSYSSTIDNRVRGHACRECKNRFGTSFAEQAIFYYLQCRFPDAQIHYNMDGYELDIYVPSRQIALEYDGARYHNSKKKDERGAAKKEICDSKNVKLLWVREEGLPEYPNAVCYTRRRTRDMESLEIIIRSILLADFELDPTDIDVDLMRDQGIIYQRYIRASVNHSLGEKYPDLVAERWDYEKNGNLLPSMVMPASMGKVWWHCKAGHTFLKSPNAMIKAINSKFCGCAACREKSFRKSLSENMDSTR